MAVCGRVRAWARACLGEGVPGRVRGRGRECECLGECVVVCVRQRARMHVCNFACLSEMRMSEFVHVHVYVCLDAYWTK